MVPYFIFFGAIARIAGALSYIKDTLQGKTKPNRVTWLIWSIAPLIAALAAFTHGVRWAAFPIFITGLVPLAIFITTFVNKHAYWKLKKFDYFCGFLSLCALIFWSITRSSSIAIIFAIASDALAGVPTFTKTWNHPKTESGIVYATALVNGFTTFTAIKAWIFPEYAFAVYMVIANTILLLAVYRKRVLPQF